MIFPKIFCIFELFNINEISACSNVNNNHTTNNNLNNSFFPNSKSLNINSNLTFIELVLVNIEKILNVNSIIENEDFIMQILNIIPKLEDLINYYTNNNNNWRLIKKINLILSFQSIYKLNISIDPYVYKIFYISRKLFINDCFEIKIDSVKILAKICKSRIIWEEVIKFVENEILNSKNYYNRRLYLYFFEELKMNFSYKFLYDKGQIDELMKLINDNNQILGKLLRLIQIFFPLVIDDKTKFLIYNKLELLRKHIQNKEIIDKEVIEVCI